MGHLNDLLPTDWRSRYSFDTTIHCWAPISAPGSLDYSDGDQTEVELLRIVGETQDLSVLSTELRRRIHDWPTRYHLSSRRANLLRPIQEHFAGSHVLEIGAGCGALTRFLGEAGCASVIAVEGSRRRAAIAAQRCCDLGNVTVVADTLQRLDPLPRFDFVLLVGVLEYARLYFPSHGGDAIDEMLRFAGKFLCPRGRLVVAIENQLGLKYFAGAREDHVSEPMFGIQNLYLPEGVVTFGRVELSRRLNQAGFAGQEWLYPFPDYKVPVSVMTEAGIHASADLSPVLAGSVVAEGQPLRRYLFSPELAWTTVFRNGLAGELANSFLVLASSSVQKTLSDDILLWHFSSERRPVFTKELVFKAVGHEILVNARPMQSAVPETGSSLQICLSEMPLVDGQHWHMELVKRLNRHGWTLDSVVQWAKVWLGALSAIQRGHEYLPTNCLDALPKNLIVNDGVTVFFDLEWISSDPLDLRYVLFRGLVSSLLAISGIAQPGPNVSLNLIALLKQVAEGLGFTYTDRDILDHLKREQKLQLDVNDCEWLSIQDIVAYMLPVRSEIQH